MFGRAAIWGGWVAAICVACGAVERDPSEEEGGTSNAGGVPVGAGTGGVTSAGGTRTGGGTTAPGGSVSVATGGVSVGGASSSGAGPATGGVTGTAGKASGGSVTGTGGKAAGGGATSGGTTSGGSFSAGAGGEAGAPGFCDDYVACGCGCCGGGAAEVWRCYYPEAGESLSSIVAADLSAAASPNCANAGCSSPARYTCCWRSGSEPVGNATYAAFYLSTALDRISIVKTGNDGRCGRLGFVLPGSQGGVHTALTLPTFNSTLSWGFEHAYDLACSMSALTGPAIGAIGSMRLRPSSGGCVLDVHITTYFERNGTAMPLHFDADGVLLEGASPNLCP